jgi:mono/diheme cytochrome c family protein
MLIPRIGRDLWAYVAIAALVAWLAPSTASAADAEAGKAMYTMNCFACHGETGKGDGPVGIALQPPPRDFSGGNFMFDTDGDGQTGTDADLRNVIVKGSAEYSGSPLMAPWPTLTDADLDNLIAYLRTLKD